MPEGEWFCETCAANPGAPIGEVPKPTKATSKMKRKEKVNDEDDERYDVDDEVGQKRKGSQKGGGQLHFIVPSAIRH